MKLENQISSDKGSDNKEAEEMSGGAKIDKETKEQTNERLAGTSNATNGSASNDSSKMSQNDDFQRSDSEGSNKLADDLSSKEGKSAKKEEVEKVEKEADENEKKEHDLHQVDSKAQIVNLETIKEGEVLEIPPDTASPQVKKAASKAQFYFYDSVVSTTFECPGADEAPTGMLCVRVSLHGLWFISNDGSGGFVAFMCSVQHLYLFHFYDTAFYCMQPQGN